MKFEPRPYQSRMMEMIESGKSAALWADMGAGKTATVLHATHNLIFDHLKHTKVLVLAPKRVAESTWVDEIDKWDIPLRIIHMDKDREKVLQNMGRYDVVTMSHNLLPWMFDYYTIPVGKKWKWNPDRTFPFTAIAIDEASKFKNPSGTWFKIVARFRRLGIQIIEMTGTPSPKGLEDLWSQAYLLDGGERLEDGITKFRHKYMQVDRYISQHVPVWSPRPGAFEEVMDRLKDIAVSVVADDWMEMPEYVHVNHFVTLPKKARELYDKLSNDMVVKVGDHIITAGSAGVLDGKLVQVGNGRVYDEDKEVVFIHGEKQQMLKTLLEDATDPVIVCYLYRHDLDAIKEVCPTVVEMDGPARIKEWNRGDIKVMALHPASAGHGLNLQEGGNVILWYGVPYDLELYQQANARLRRPGQKQRSVFIHHILSKGTKDEKVIKVLTKKDATQQDVIDAVRYV